MRRGNREILFEIFIDCLNFEQKPTTTQIALEPLSREGYQDSGLMSRKGVSIVLSNSTRDLQGGGGVGKRSIWVGLTKTPQVHPCFLCEG